LNNINYLVDNPKIMSSFQPDVFEICVARKRGIWLAIERRTIM